MTRKDDIAEFVLRYKGRCQLNGVYNYSGYFNVSIFNN